MPGPGDGHRPGLPGPPAGDRQQHVAHLPGLAINSAYVLLHHMTRAGTIERVSQGWYGPPGASAKPQWLLDADAWHARYLAASSPSAQVMSS